MDARLNSIHLEGLRRDEFRSARDKLLHARGGETMALERLAERAPQQTAILNSEQPACEAQFLLVDKDYVYPLRVGLNTVGRLADNDVVVPDAYVSRRHCAIVVHATNGCELHDVASKNGTFLNGCKINGPTRLNSGDEIRMCNRQLVFVKREDARPRTPEQPTRHE